MFRFVGLFLLLLSTTLSAAERKIPVYLSQSTYRNNPNRRQWDVPKPLHLIRVARDHWKLDGVELSVEAMIGEAGSHAGLKASLPSLALDLKKEGVPKQEVPSDVNDQFMTQLKKEGLTFDRPEFNLHLTIERPEQNLDIALEVLKHLPIRSASIQIAENDVIGFSKSRSAVLRVRPSVMVMCENWDLGSGVDTGIFVKSLAGISAMMTMERVQYRSDLAIHDYKEATKTTPHAIRFVCDTTQTHNGNEARFGRALLRHCLVDVMKGEQPMFISLTSSYPVEWRPWGAHDGINLASFNSMTMTHAFLAVKEALAE